MAIAPILVAVATSYLAMTGVKYFIASRRNKPGSSDSQDGRKAGHRGLIGATR